jgi:hypothetical protein
MEISKENAIELWEERYGFATKAYDYSGRGMDKSAFGNQNSSQGWNIDHIRPESKGGSNKKCNLKIVNIRTNEEKADAFPHWTANGKKFKAKKTETNCYEIVEDN